MLGVRCELNARRVKMALATGASQQKHARRDGNCIFDCTDGAMVPLMVNAMFGRCVHACLSVYPTLRRTNDSKSRPKQRTNLEVTLCSSHGLVSVVLVLRSELFSNTQTPANNPMFTTTMVEARLVYVLKW